MYIYTHIYVEKFIINYSVTYEAAENGADDKNICNTFIVT